MKPTNAEAKQGAGDESAFTPGPWKICRHASTAVEGSTGFVVASTGGYSDNRRDPDDLMRELQANARLIASSPELVSEMRETANALDQLAQVARFHEMNGIAANLESLARKNRAALAKATARA